METFDHRRFTERVLLHDAPAAVSTAPAAPVAASMPEPLQYRIKNKLLGAPLHTERLEHKTLGKPTALAVFASDNLSSSAYATEEILRVLLPWMGFAAFTLVTPITIALLVVLGFLIGAEAPASPQLTVDRRVGTSGPIAGLGSGRW